MQLVKTQLNKKFSKIPYNQVKATKNHHNSVISIKTLKKPLTFSKYHQNPVKSTSIQKKIPET